MLSNQINNNKIYNSVNNLSLVLVTFLYIVYYQCDPVSCSRTSNFHSVPTTVKAYENDTVVLPCTHNCKLQIFVLCFNVLKS